MNNGRITVSRTKLNAVQALRGISNRQLAEAIGASYNGILRIKKDESTSLNTLAKICTALQCSPNDILVMDGFPEPFLDGQQLDKTEV